MTAKVQAQSQPVTQFMHSVLEIYADWFKLKPTIQDEDGRFFIYCAC